MPHSLLYRPYVASLLQVAGYVGVAYPLGVLSRLFLRAHRHWRVLCRSTCPKLVVTGTGDQFTALGTLTNRVANYR